jgi:hypothetical protein
MQAKSVRWQLKGLSIGGRTRRGQIVMFVGLLFPVLLGFMGLALDVGFMYHVKRRMQTAADAGAIGGAQEIWRANTTLVTSAAANDVALNGYNDKNATVTVNYPPASGPRAGDAGFVEVIIGQQAPTFFMRIINQQSTFVRSRAVAGLMRASDYCVVALDPTKQGALTVQGTATLAANCGVMVNSTDAKGIVANGGGCIYGSAVGVSGSYSAGGSTTCIVPAPVAGVPPVIDPLAYLTPPPIPLPPAIGLNTIITGGSVTLNPGLYVGGITILSGNVRFNPGTYILDGGGLQASGNAVLNGDGVMFYNTLIAGVGAWGTFNINGTVIATLKAPSTGPYEGVLFWDDKNAPDKPPGNVITGSANSVYVGAFYFPSTNLTYTGTSTAVDWNMIVANTITISGNASVQGSSPASSVQPPIRKALLTE